MRTLSGKYYVRLPVLLLMLMLGGLYALHAQGPDLPNPPANFETIKNSSYVIAMDNTNQSLTGDPFNLKAYGLVNALLQDSIPVKWAIRSNKAKDAIDFTHTCERVYPSFVAAASYDFKAGPFIIEASYVLKAAPIISAFGNNIAVYKLIGNKSIDIRYTITHKPKIAVFSNGGNQNIHTQILDYASIPDYTVFPASAIISDSNVCYTFASEPHWDSREPADTSEVYAVKTFVNTQGNFLAQCEGVETYCYFDTFHTTKGILSRNVNLSPHFYYNPDLAYMQFEGTVREKQGGSLKNWTRDSAIGSVWSNQFYMSMGRTSDSVIVAGGAKYINPALKGGNVYYLGGHDYFGNSIDRINALRMYLNCAFVPAVRPDTCNLNFLLSVGFLSFEAELIKNSDVLLKWTTSTEINNDYFTIERSPDGYTFEPIGYVMGGGNSSKVLSYSFKDKYPFKQVSYYRLRQTDYDGRYTYSKTISINIDNAATPEFRAYPNPSDGNNINISFSRLGSEEAFVTLYGQAGKMLFSKAMQQNNRQFYTSFDLLHKLSPGIYVITADVNGKQYSLKLLVYYKEASMLDIRDDDDRSAKAIKKSNRLIKRCRLR